MASTNCVISTIIAISILSISIVEATIADPPQAQKTTPKGSPEASPASPECARDYINFHLDGATAKTKDFLNNNIEKRLNDPAFGKSDKGCLLRCFQAYHAALATIEKATVDVSKNAFSSAIVDVVAYSSFIRSTMNLKCSSNVIVENPDFSGMQRWAEWTAGDILKRLKVCAK